MHPPLLFVPIQFGGEHAGYHRHSFRQAGAEMIRSRRDDSDAEFFAVAFACQRLDLGIEVGIVLDGGGHGNGGGDEAFYSNFMLSRKRRGRV